MVSLLFLVAAREFHETACHLPRFWTHFGASRDFKCLAASEKGIGLRWQLAAGLYMAGLRFSPYAEALSRQLGEVG